MTAGGFANSSLPEIRPQLHFVGSTTIWRAFDKSANAWTIVLSTFDFRLTRLLKNSASPH
jgi:hypothetical protein